MKEIKRKSKVSELPITKKDKKIYEKMICVYCGLEIGTYEPMYFIKGKAFHDVCEINHLWNKYYEKDGDKNDKNL